MANNALKSINFTNFVKILMWFLVSCSKGGGKVWPVRTMAFRRILLSFSSYIQFRIMWLIVYSSFSPQKHVELGIILNLWRYVLRFLGMMCRMTAGSFHCLCPSDCSGWRPSAQTACRYFPLSLSFRLLRLTALGPNSLSLLGFQVRRPRCVSSN